jgi:competence protein ComEA
VQGVSSFAGRRPLAVVAVVIALVVALCTAIALSGHQEVAESAPALPPAVSAAPTPPPSSPPTPTSLVISVVGRVAHPGLVTLPDGARVADALTAAGGPIPGADDLALNLARRLTDGEQIYVGIPTPAGSDPAPPDNPSQPPEMEGATSASKIDLNTATEEQLETLPGVGPALAQHILTWRSQHNHFDSINQLRDVDGIGDGRYAKLEKLVTT